MATAQLVAAVPFYAGLTLEEIGGRGVRWPARDGRRGLPRRRARRATPAPTTRPGRRRAARANGRLRLGTFRSIWNATEVRVSPALHFLHPELRVEMAPADAQRLELFQGDRVVVGSDGQTVDATVTAARGHARGQRLPGDQRARGPAGGGPQGMTAALRRGRLLRAVVDADPQGDRDLRRRPAARARRAGRRAQAARALPEPLRAQPRRPLRRSCSRWPTSSSSSPRSSSARAPRSAGCSRSRR